MFTSNYHLCIWSKADKYIPVARYTSVMGSLDVSVMYQLVWIILNLGLPALLTYLVNTLVASEPFRRTLRDRSVPLTPYWIPVLGHGLSFFWNTAIVGELSKCAISLPNVFGLGGEYGC